MFYEAFFVVTVQKMITEALPQNVKCSKEARDLIAECCTGILVAYFP